MTTKPRLRKAPHLLGVLYLAWSSFVYFGSYGTANHAWWPIFVYGPIWPWSWAIECLLDPLQASLAPEPHATPESVFMAMDQVAGAGYIVIGSVWYWCLGKLVSIGATKLFGVRSGPASETVKAR